MNPYEPQPTTDKQAYQRLDWFSFGMVAGFLLAIACEELQRQGIDPVAFLLSWST
jgi:hypothetical protein